MDDKFLDFPGLHKEAPTHLEFKNKKPTPCFLLRLLLSLVPDSEVIL